MYYMHILSTRHPNSKHKRNTTKLYFNSFAKNPRFGDLVALTGGASLRSGLALFVRLDDFGEMLSVDLCDLELGLARLARAVAP